MLIRIREKIEESEIEKIGCRNWGTWSKEVSEFPWSYNDNEECLIIEGSATVEADGKSYTFTAGDYVQFKKGFKCTWKVTQPIRKYFNLY